MSLVILTNIPTPYRTAFFDALAAQAALAGKPFHVLYCAKTVHRRLAVYETAKMRQAIWFFASSTRLLLAFIIT